MNVETFVDDSGEDAAFIVQLIAKLRSRMISTRMGLTVATNECFVAQRERSSAVNSAIADIAASRRAKHCCIR